MALQHLKLAKGQFSDNATPQVILSLASNSSVKEILIHNTYAYSVDIEIYDNGTTIADRILKLTLDPNETIEWTFGYIFPVLSTEVLNGKASVNNVVNYEIVGAEDI